MEKDRLKWNQKHREIEAKNVGPSETLLEYHQLAPGKRALDIACGLGRHSKFLASQDYSVDAVDISDYAIGKLSGMLGIEATQIDIDGYTPPPNTYDLICNFFFLERRLFGPIVEALTPGGILIFETFAKHPDHELPENTQVDHYLCQGELKEAFKSLRTLHYDECEFTRSDGVKCQLTTLVAEKNH